MSGSWRLASAISLSKPNDERKTQAVVLTGHDLGGLLVEAVDERVAVGLAEHRGGQREEQLGASLELALELGSDLRQLALVLRGGARAPRDGRVGPVARAVVQPLPATRAA